MNNVFLAGEKIDLCVPEEEDVDQWASWFNCQKITQYLEQGKYPNTPAQQRLFYTQAVAEGRFLCVIKTKAGILLGVISLSEIDHVKATCQVAYVCPQKSDDAPQAPLEALAICTQHAFERFGMRRIWAGHSYPGLERWIQKTELLGYKTEGILPHGFIHGKQVNDALRTSITYERYEALVRRRNGNLWPGEAKVIRMLSALREHPPLSAQVHQAILDLHQRHDRLLNDIEVNASL